MEGMVRKNGEMEGWGGGEDLARFESTCIYYPGKYDPLLLP